MSASTVALNQQAEGLIEQLRTLLAYGSVPSETVLYETELMASYFFANLARCRSEQQQGSVIEKIYNDGTPMADLMGR